jgi:integrase
LDLIVRTERGGRELREDEQNKVSAVYSPWMHRLAGFAVETCLSEGDLLRLTESMVDEKAGDRAGWRQTINWRRHIAPLTNRARAILEEIRAEHRSGSAVPNVTGILFTSEDGKPITKGQIEYQV